MEETRARDLRELLRRVDEVRGLSDGAETSTALEPGDTDALLRTLGDLVGELERSHRRLIETRVQLVSLREVASHVVAANDLGEATRTITRYLARAFGFRNVCLLLVEPERRVLIGTWTHREGAEERSVAVEVPATGDGGTLARAVWLNRTLVQLNSLQHPPLVVPDGHLLLDLIEDLGPMVCVPLQRSQSLVPGAEPHELCGARCILGDAAAIVPPPGPAAERWAHEREERQTQCLRCEIMPMMGVLGVARGAGEGANDGDVRELVESIALSVAPLVENAQLHQELRRSEQFRENILDSMSSALVAVNMRGEILTFNPAAADLLGWEERDALGRPFADLCGSEGGEILAATLEQGRPARREETLLRTRGGGTVPVSLTTSLLRRERGAVYGAIAVFVDLTPIKRAEEQARRLDRLAALGRFTSSVAHEIRNPLAGIAAGAQYLTKALPELGPQRESMDFIEREIRRLDRILQDLFDITHPRALRLRQEPVEEAARRALQCVAALAESRGVRVGLEVTPRTPPATHDADQLEQVILNLCKNAIEASPEGAAVEVRVGPAPPGGGRARAGPPAVRVTVSDSGSGIPEAHLRTIFEPFFTTKKEGSGLGLYVSHDIVKRHGGTIAVRSEPGSGTVFTLELPLEPTGGIS